jgi:hydroxybutyrate-dimer hydrolase
MSTQWPSYVVGKVRVTDYCGAAKPPAPAKDDRAVYRVADAGDDLQSAGLTTEDIQKPFVPDRFVDPAAELRRLAIYTNYIALMDVSAFGGFGVRPGTTLTGKVYGREYVALARLADDDAVITLMCQIPADFDEARPLIITAPASGSRGIYGAVSMNGWAFRNRAAVAFNDKGGGPGFNHLDRDIAYDVEGLPITAGSTSDEALFVAPKTAELAAFRKAFPNRLGVKHAHSGVNPERYWGRHLLLSIGFSKVCLVHYLEDRGRQSLSVDKIKVIAAGVSNGGGAALRAAEQDDSTRPEIDAVVVSEPQVQPQKGGDFVIVYGDTVFADHSRGLLDIATLMDVYAPSAAYVVDPTDRTSPDQQRRARRSALLRSRGLLAADDAASQGHEALAIIHAAGMLPDAKALLPFHEFAGLWRALAMTYANAYGQTGVSCHVCGVSAAAVDDRGTPKPADGKLVSQMCGWGTGLGFFSPLGSVTYVDARPQNDFNLGAALCFRSLVTGQDYIGQTPVGPSWLDTARIRKGIDEVRAKGKLGGRPTIILHGRSDALIAPNHSSRPYYALNKQEDGPDSPTRYIEVVNGNHFDTFISLLGPKTLVPMHHYLDCALDLMRAHLYDGAPLPDSQVIRASGASRPWTEEGSWKNGLPEIVMNAAPGERIEFKDKALKIPR